VALAGLPGKWECAVRIQGWIVPSTGRRRNNGEVKNGKYEEQKDHRFGKRSLGFLLLYVLAKVGKTSDG
jgi:hypothetical protein